MPLETIRIGDLPRIQQLDVPAVMGDLRVRKLYEAPDSHFSDGWGLEMMEKMEMEFLQRCMADTFEQVALHEILENYGALQIRCPELRHASMEGQVVPREFPITLHKDSEYPSRNKDTVMMGDCYNWPGSGGTLVMTNRIAVQVLLQHGHHIGFDKESDGIRIEAIRDCRANEAEYARGNSCLEQIIARGRRSFNCSGVDQQNAFLDSVEADPHVLTHSWVPSNESFDVLAFSNLRMIHGRSNLSNGSVVVCLPEKPFQVELRHELASPAL